MILYRTQGGAGKYFRASIYVVRELVSLEKNDYIE